MAVQGILVCAIGLLAFVPPANGLMLLVPLTPAAAAQIDDVAAAAGGTLAGPGPLPGSRYVAAERAALFAPALRHGLLLFSGSPRFCAAPSGNPK
ncbi:hypothetical protein AB2M62_20005 [Sphingomonas sp. MMS12-HWE2-04]|uniref:hypothetical protein n=1 Tax=Sphingomonas sp. MMS12-HWE2-04 TaxID=3234199 RepID=UPI00384DB3F1